MADTYQIPNWNILSSISSWAVNKMYNFVILFFLLLLNMTSSTTFSSLCIEYKLILRWGINGDNDSKVHTYVCMRSSFIPSQIKNIFRYTPSDCYKKEATLFFWDYFSFNVGSKKEKPILSRLSIVFEKWFLQNMHLKQNIDKGIIIRINKRIIFNMSPSLYKFTLAFLNSWL